MRKKHKKNQYLYHNQWKPQNEYRKKLFCIKKYDKYGKLLKGKTNRIKQIKTKPEGTNQVGNTEFDGLSEKEKYSLYYSLSKQVRRTRRKYNNKLEMLSKFARKSFSSKFNAILSSSIKKPYNSTIPNIDLKYLIKSVKIARGIENASNQPSFLEDFISKIADKQGYLESNEFKDIYNELKGLRGKQSNTNKRTVNYVKAPVELTPLPFNIDNEFVRNFTCLSQIQNIQNSFSSIKMPEEESSIRFFMKLASNLREDDSCWRDLMHNYSAMDTINNEFNQSIQNLFKGLSENK